MGYAFVCAFKLASLSHSASTRQLCMNALSQTRISLLLLFSWRKENCYSGGSVWKYSHIFSNSAQHSYVYDKYLWQAKTMAVKNCCKILTRASSVLDFSWGLSWLLGSTQALNCVDSSSLRNCLPYWNLQHHLGFIGTPALRIHAEFSYRLFQNCEVPFFSESSLN